MNEADLRDLISGKKRGAIPALARSGLKALSVGYAVGAAARNWLFDRGFRKIHRAAVPVVSVGNITTGGTGKTPFVAWLARLLTRRVSKIVLISRGYRSLDDSANDEKRLLDRMCPGLIHLQDPDRVHAAEIAVREHGAQLILLDDGFQHRRLARDLDIVLIDALNPWGYGHLLPRGLLRESSAALRRADVVVLTRVDQCSLVEKEQILTQIEKWRGDSECLEAVFEPLRLINASGYCRSVDALPGGQVVAFCGIGNPDGFRRTLESLGVDIRDGHFLLFPDHCAYGPEHLEAIARAAQRTQAPAIITTAKDLVKFQSEDIGGTPLWAVEIGMRIAVGEQQLFDRLGKIVNLGDVAPPSVPQPSMLPQVRHVREA